MFLKYYEVTLAILLIRGSTNVFIFTITASSPGKYCFFNKLILMTVHDTVKLDFMILNVINLFLLNYSKF